MAKAKWLLFIDTNIFLDFYRARTKEGLSLLKHLPSVADRTITTYQVAMEYMKNRQGVLRNAQSLLKHPDAITPPICLTDAQAIKTHKKHISEAATRIKKAKKKLQRMMLIPGEDEVYKAAQAVFNVDSPFNLKRPNPLRYTIRRLARKRFVLGYPPRKAKDTSIGDAVNWEWLIHCSKESKQHIVIASRDGDYGITIDGQSYLNDWLLQEFRERLTHMRKVHLTASLSEALTMMGVKVRKGEAEGEKKLLASQTSRVPLDSLLGILRLAGGAKRLSEEQRMITEALLSPAPDEPEQQ